MALYSKECNLLFFHVPCCGGQTIRKVIKDCYIETTEIGRTYSSAFEVLQEFIRMNRADEFYEARKFAFVRNPYHWAAALYEHVISNNAHALYREIRNQSFKDFINWLLSCIAAKRESGNVRFMPQADFLCNAEGRLYDMDIGKVDYFSRDLVTILKMLDIIPDSIKHENSSKKCGEYMLRYDKHLIEKVNSFFAKDFEMFHFEKRP